MYQILPKEKTSYSEALTSKYSQAALNSSVSRANNNKLIKCSQASSSFISVAPIKYIIYINSIHEISYKCKKSTTTEEIVVLILALRQREQYQLSANF
nr:MAG TPA: hypothetical protein [Caudoviricetes sp.]